MSRYQEKQNSGAERKKVTNSHKKVAVSRGRRSRNSAGRFMVGVIAVLLILACSFSFGSFFSSAHDVQAKTGSDLKYFKSVRIEKGDTLWTIAQTYCTREEDSIYDYMNELAQINGIDSASMDYLREGDYLTIVYYEANPL